MGEGIGARSQRAVTIGEAIQRLSKRYGDLLRGRADSQLIHDNWKKIEDAQVAIERSVALPTIKISDANTSETSG